MTTREAGGKVYFEPTAIVTYVPGPPIKLSDIHFYMLRWSDAWELASLHHLLDKWNLNESQYFKNRYRRLGWRRKMTIMQPLARRLTRRLGFGKKFFLEKILVPLDKMLNRYLTNRHIQQERHRQQTQETPTPSRQSALTASSQR